MYTFKLLPYFYSFILPNDLQVHLIIASVFSCAVLSPVWLFVTPRTVAFQAPLSIGIPQARLLE